MNAGMAYWPLFLLVSCVGYWLPGYALLQLVSIRGLSRWGQGLLAVPVSLVIVPYGIALFAGFVHFTPSFFPVVLLSLLVWAVAWLLKRSGRSIVLDFGSADRGTSPVRWTERLIASAFILGISLAFNLPRLEMFVHGSQALVAASGDEYWHIAELTAVARSGVPPFHYFFPDFPLSYYFWSWFYPALIANQGIVDVALARALALHALVQTVAFLGLMYYFVRETTRTWTARVLGMGFVTVLGGFDVFPTLGGGASIEWWQEYVPWLRSSNEISSFATLYIWVPQHVAAAMAFLMGLITWRLVRGPTWLRAAITGTLLAFSLGSSAFVFLGFMLALFIWMLLNWRALLSRRAVWYAGVFGLVFMAGAWWQLLLTLHRPGAIVLSNFRVPLLESYLGIHTPLFERADRLMSDAALPLVGTWIMLIEMGLPFALFLVWLFKGRWWRESSWTRLVGVYPVLALFLVFLFQDVAGGKNLAMRGFILGQILIVLGATCVLDDWKWRGLGLGTKLLLAYLILQVGVAQAVSGALDLRFMASAPIGSVLRVPGEVKFAGMVLASAPSWPGSLEYIHWLNLNAPKDALIVETGPLPKDDKRFRLLERMRYLSPSDACGLLYTSNDFDLLGSSRPSCEENAAAAAPGDVLAAAEKTEYVQTRHPDILLVCRIPSCGTLGKRVYSDQYVNVLSIDYPGQ
ncbi:MAG: hypothetical protein ABSB61_09930 [Anaerolineales bacterium]|jgi:hypothetical protein